MSGTVVNAVSGQNRHQWKASYSPREAKGEIVEDDSEKGTSMQQQDLLEIRTVADYADDDPPVKVYDAPASNA